MKIRELLKYAVLPASLAVCLLSTDFLEDVFLDTSSNAFILAFVIIFLLIVSVAVATFFTQFKLFKNRESGFLYIFIIFIPLTFIDAEFSSILLFLITVGYLIFTIMSIPKVKVNGHLMFFLIMAGIVFSLNFVAYMLGINFLMKSKIFMQITLGLYVVMTFALIFSLPNSNFMDWRKEHRQFFLKVIIAPWIVVLFLAFKGFFLNTNIDTSRIKPDGGPPWNMEKYEIKINEGSE